MRRRLQKTIDFADDEIFSQIYLHTHRTLYSIFINEYVCIIIYLIPVAQCQIVDLANVIPGKPFGLLSKFDKV